MQNPGFNFTFFKYFTSKFWSKFFLCIKSIGSGWKLSLRNYLCYIPLDHNKIDALNLVEADTSKQMKIKQKFCRLGPWCHWFMWLETLSTVSKKVFADSAKHTILAHFLKNCPFKNCINSCNDDWWPVPNHEAIFLTYSAYFLSTLLTLSKVLLWHFWHFWLLILSYM